MATVTIRSGRQLLHGRISKDSDLVYYVTKSGKQYCKVMPKCTKRADQKTDSQRKNSSRFKEACQWAHDVMNRVDGQEQYDELHEEFSRQRKYVIFRNFLIAKYMKN